MAPTEQEHGPGRASRTASSGPGLRHALIIEDDAIIALEIEDRLRDLGYDSFDIAVSPAEALSCATARRPDLITADVRSSAARALTPSTRLSRAWGRCPSSTSRATLICFEKRLASLWWRSRSSPARSLQPVRGPRPRIEPR